MKKQINLCIQHDLSKTTSVLKTEYYNNTTLTNKPIKILNIKKTYSAETHAENAQSQHKEPKCKGSRRNNAAKNYKQ